MKSQFNICIQCGTEYQYISSAYGGIPNAEVNDSIYCPDCKAIINKALSKVPKKFIDKHIDASTEITLNQLISIEIYNKQCNDDETNGHKYSRCYPGLYNVNGDTQYNRDIKIYNDTYHLSTWVHSPEYTITRSVRWNIKENKATDGKQYNNPITLIDNSKIDSYKKYVSEHKNRECSVITIKKPVGIEYALRFLGNDKSAIGYDL